MNLTRIAETPDAAQTGTRRYRARPHAGRLYSLTAPTVSGLLSEAVRG